MTKRILKQWYRRGAWWRKLLLNRTHKDKLFRFLFRDKRHLLELYNALHDSSYSNPEDLEVVTMEDVIFMKMKNDLSFIIDSRLNLYEHQSTWNPNMPMRGFLYFAQQYEGLLGMRQNDLYGKTDIVLPTPLYVVFYNGSELSKDREILYLSDSFSEGRGSGCLECTCEVINIKRGHNQNLLYKSRRLWEYSEFISEIESNMKKGMNRKAAVETAIEYCINQDILADVLRREKGEVFHMILTEYDEKKHFRHLREEGRYELLLEQIRKKQAKGKSMEIIAEELEETVESLQDVLKKTRRWL